MPSKKTKKVDPSKARFKSCSYTQDLQQPREKPAIEFTGLWSPRDLDRMYKHLKRGLRQYKLKMLKEARENESTS